MTRLIARVFRSEELVDVMECPVAFDDGQRMMAAALADDRALPVADADMRDGELWVELIDEEGDILSDEPACFHPADAHDALALHFGASRDLIRRSLSAANVTALYKEHRASVREILSATRKRAV